MWTGGDPDPQYNGYTERDGEVIHFIELRPGLIAAGTLQDLQERLGRAGLALADAERELARDREEEGRRRAALSRQYLA